MGRPLVSDREKPLFHIGTTTSISFRLAPGWTPGMDGDQHIAWVRGLWEASQSFTDEAVYVNDLGDEGHDRVRAAYGQNYDRLLALKKKFDPTNFFRLNQNIEV